MSLHELNRVFGMRIKEFRLARGLSQEQLGSRVELHRTYIGQIERAEKNISLSTVGKIAEKLELNIDELLKDHKIK
ncbi:MAG: helix-turn-helix domain-containing protein [Alphaproteobacteria bacterium]